MTRLVYLFFIPFVFFTVFSAHATRVGVNNSGCIYTTIQAAINAAQSGDTLKISAGTYGETISIEDKALVLEGNYNSSCSSIVAGTTRINGGGATGSRVFVENGNNIPVTLKSLHISDCPSANGGGGILIKGGHVILDNTKVFNNKADSGAGIWIYGNQISRLTLQNDSDIYNNTATSQGGGILGGGPVMSEDASSEIYGNSANIGGGIDMDGELAILDIKNMKIYSNTATGDLGWGGGIYSNGCTLNLDNVGLYDNSAIEGGAIHLKGGGAKLIGHNLSIGTSGANKENTAEDGAGIYSDEGTISLTNSIFQNNEATNYGGAVYLANDSSFNAINNQLFFNRANASGGALYSIDSTVVMDVNHSSCSKNLSTCSNISFNTADSDSNLVGNGGAVYSFNSSLSLNRSYLRNNSARFGGAVYQAGTSPSATFSNSLFFSNSDTAGSYGVLRALQGDATFNHCTIAGNSGVAVTFSSGGINTINNSIVYNNGGGISGTVSNHSCNIDQGGVYGTNQNPQFISTLNYKLQETSPAIDACSGIGLSYDLNSNHRPIGSLYDIGAFEYGTYNPWPFFLPAIIEGAR